MTELELVYDPLPGEALMRFLENGIIDHTLAATGISTWHPVGFFLKGPPGEWLGGCTGHVWGGWLHIKFLWVHARLRGQGQGTRLLDTAERFAAERGAAQSTLETHSYQAIDFYLKRGYTVFGELEDYPPGHRKFFLRKRLSAMAG